MNNADTEYVLIQKKSFFDAADALKKRKNCVIFGDEGSGKTSFIKAVVHDLSAVFHKILYYPCGMVDLKTFQFPDDALVIIDDIQYADIKNLKKIFCDRSFSQDNTVFIAGLSKNTKNPMLLSFLQEYFQQWIVLSEIWESDYGAELVRFFSDMFQKKYGVSADVSKIALPSKGGIRKLKQAVEGLYCASENRAADILTTEYGDTYIIKKTDTEKFCAEYLFFEQKPEIILLTEISKSVEQLLKQKNFELHTRAEAEKFDIALADADRIQDKSLWNQMHLLKDKIVITGAPETRKITEKSGITHFVEKPVPFQGLLSEIRDVMNDAAKNRREKNRMRAKDFFKRIAGSHPAVIMALKGMKKAASEKCLFFYGPEGSGKTHFAQYAAGNTEFELIDLNCGKLPHTEASNIIIENVHMADNYSEMEDMLYSDRIQKIICTSLQPPEMLQKRMRERAFYFLTGHAFFMLPLSSRKIDIMDLAACLLARISISEGGKKKSLSERGLVKLMRYNWPKNVKELEYILYCAWTTAENSLIEAEHILL